MPYPANSLSIGILGGGQLARMLCIQGQQLGFDIHVLSPHPTDPAAQVCGHWVQGSPSDEKTIRSFIKNLKYVTFESEFVDVQLLKKMGSRKFYPSLKNMGLFQTRQTQKNWLTQHKIKTASPFSVLDPGHLEYSEIQNSYRGGFVLKECFGGYDGYGTYMSRKDKPLSETKIKSLLKKSKHGLLIEPLVPFKRELALSFFRSPSGQILSYPLVETFQKDHKCFWVKGPIKHPKLSSLQNKIKKALHASHYVGAIAFELFDTGSELLVNEVAPRVHNSAHYSLEAFYYDQFSLHLLAVSDQLPKSLGKPITPAFAMVNLIGSSHKKTMSLPNLSDGKLHWYGKKECRPGRKMGHINKNSHSSSQALKTLLQLERNIKI